MERETVDNGGQLYASFGLRGAIPFEVLLAMLWFYLSILTQELPPPQLPTLTFNPASLMHYPAAGQSSGSAGKSVLQQ